MSADEDRALREKVKPAPDERGTFVVDGLTLGYEIHDATAGAPRDAPTAVFLPGVGFPRVYFRPLAALLKSRVRCVLLDTRGAGDSEAPARDEDYDLEHQALDVIALLDEVGAKRAWIVGHSLGSNIAIACAAKFPARIDGVVVVSAALSAALVADHLRAVWDGADPALRDACAKYERRGPVFVGEGPPEEYGLASSQIYQAHVVRGHIDTDVMWSMRQAIGPAGALWGRESAFRITGSFGNIDQRELVKQVACPLVAVAGGDDEYARSSLPFIERAPQGRVVRMPDSLHHAHVEEPVRVAEIVLDAMFPRAADDTPRLRLDVTVAVDDDVARVADELTGFSFALPAWAAPAIDALGGPRANVEAAIANALGDDAPDADEIANVVHDLVAQLDDLALLRRDEPRARAEIERTQKTSRAKHRAYERFDEVKSAIARAAVEVPLYRARFAGVNIDELEGGDDLARLPPLEKSDVRKNFPDGFARDGVDVQKLLAEGKLTIGATSGTSEERLQVLFDWTRGGLPERAEELWDLPGDAKLAKGAVFTTPLCAGFECHLGTTAPAERTRGTTLTLNSTEDLFSLKDAEVKAIASELAMHAPDVLFIHPWYGAWLAHRARDLGIELHKPTVVLTSYQLLTRRQRALLREAFRAPVFSYWGATDLGGALLGVECHCGRMHVREDQVFVEIEPLVTDAIEAHEPSLRGTLVVTVLGDPLMPLVRYRISDVARFDDDTRDPCACALGGEWRTLTLFGRAGDAISAVSGATLYTKDVDDALGVEGPDFWKLTQRASAYDLEVLGSIASEPLERLSALLGKKPRVISVKRFSPERSLKFRQTQRAR